MPRRPQTTTVPLSRAQVASLRVASVLLSGVLVAVAPALRGAPDGLGPPPTAGSAVSTGR